MFGLASFAQTTFAGLASGFGVASASIYSDATTSIDFNRVRLNSQNISISSELLSYGLKVKDAASIIDIQSEIDPSAFVIASANSLLDVDGYVSINFNKVISFSGISSSQSSTFGSARLKWVNLDGSVVDWGSIAKSAETWETIDGINGSWNDIGKKSIGWSEIAIASSSWEKIIE